MTLTDTYETVDDTETLTPEEQEFKESLLGNFETSYGTYTSILDAMNDTPELKMKPNKLEVGIFSKPNKSLNRY